MAAETVNVSSIVNLVLHFLLRAGDALYHSFIKSLIDISPVFFLFALTDSSVFKSDTDKNE